MFVHSVQLARRVLQLERANSSLRNEMEKEKAKKDLLGKEVHTCFQILNMDQNNRMYCGYKFNISGDSTSAF